MKDRPITSKIRVEHALEAIGHIQRMTEDVELQRFKEDVMIYSAVFYQFAVVAEAMANVDSDVLAKYDYPWFKVKSFRNFLLHEYHSIDLEIPFDTIKKVLPGLETTLIEILQKEFSETL
ncbi:MAG: DUF86 domain-containing protein [Flavobacteriales bacterium]|nr:DUF86 domain-containing protein [Flavobacteriales bacterium]